MERFVIKRIQKRVVKVRLKVGQVIKAILEMRVVVCSFVITRHAHERSTRINFLPQVQELVTLCTVEIIHVVRLVARHCNEIVLVTLGSLDNVRQSNSVVDTLYIF